MQAVEFLWAVVELGLEITCCALREGFSSRRRRRSPPPRLRVPVRVLTFEERIAQARVRRRNRAIRRLIRKKFKHPQHPIPNIGLNCPKCGDSLTRIGGDLCPHCGWAIDLYGMIDFEAGFGLIRRRRTDSRRSARKLRDGKSGVTPDKGSPERALWFQPKGNALGFERAFCD
jgi:hypothetical protein